MQEKLRTAKLMHVALTASPAFALGVFYFVRSQMDEIARVPELYLSSLAMAVAAPFVSHFVAARLAAPRVAQFQADANASGKLIGTHYTSLKIVQWAIVEGVVFFQAVTYYLNGEIVNLGVGVLLLVYMATLRPSEADLQKRFELNETRMRQLR